MIYPPFSREIRSLVQGPTSAWAVVLLWVWVGTRQACWGLGGAGETVGATDNDGVHWALLGARKHHVVLPSKCQGGLALLPGQQPAQATSGLPRVQPVTTGVPALAPLTITLCLIRGWICFLNTGL